MLDPVQLPILMKAIDFVFDEGRKILEERRERRKMEAATLPPAGGEPEKDPVPIPVQQKEEIKQDLLASKVDDMLWLNHEMEIQHLVRMLETYSRNYHISKEQYAKWGSALVPPIIVHNLTEAENSMIATLQQLETALSKVYKKEITASQ